MNSPFPTLGAPDRLGRRGMFIGEVHEDMEHMQRLLHAWPILHTHIDVMFLEQFDAGHIPPTSSLEDMRGAIAQSTGWPAHIWQSWKEDPARYSRVYERVIPSNYMLPDHMLRLAQAAKRTGTPLRGINVIKEPEHFEHRKRQLFHELWERAITENLNQLFGTTVGKRYAVFGGALHGPLLKKCIPQLITYTLKDMQYREYDTVGYNAHGQVVFTG